MFFRSSICKSSYDNPTKVSNIRVYDTSLKEELIKTEPLKDSEPT